MLQAGIVTENNGRRFACPIVMAKKSSGEWRFYVDMRGLNVFFSVYHELPLVVDVMDVMARKRVKIMSTLDFRAAYHQIPLRPDTSDLLTPHTGRGRKYLKLPTGSSRSPFYMSVTLK